jgi:4-hydroxybenzoate polyprenyltransferase
MKAYARLVALPHTVFSLPFAVGAAVIAGERAGFVWARLAWIVVAVIGARTAAMAFNRWADRDLDARNPRTAMRELPTGQVAPRAALALTWLGSLLFLVAAWRLGRLTLMLAPIALAVCLGYSLAKRFTSYPHLVLGVALAGAPAGAWIAMTGGFHLAALVLSIAVATWVAGFDLIYACQDVDFDRRHGVGAFPARYGVGAALRFSAMLHLVTGAALFGFGAMLRLGVPYFVGASAMCAALIIEHAMVSPKDLSRVGRAFFTANGWIAILFGACTVVEALT